MSRAPLWLRRAAGVGGLLMMGALGTAMVAFVGDLSERPLIEGDPVASSQAVLFAAATLPNPSKFGRPFPFGSDHFVNDPTADGRTR